LRGILQDVTELRVDLLDLVLEPLVGGVQAEVLLGDPLLPQEELCRDTEAVEQGNDLSIQEALAEGGAPDNVESKVFRWKLDLAVSQEDLVVPAGVAWVSEHGWVATDGEDALRATESDLEGADVRELEPRGNLLCDVCSDEAATVREDVSISLDVWIGDIDVSGAQSPNVLRGGEALASASISFQYVLLVLE
jgi:hypothetical protein